MAAPPDKTQTRSQAALSASERRDKLVKEMITKERAETDAKTAKLRALRLAKEATEVPVAAAPKGKAKRAR